MNDERNAPDEQIEIFVVVPSGNVGEIASIGYFINEEPAYFLDEQSARNAAAEWAALGYRTFRVVRVTMLPLP